MGRIKTTGDARTLILSYESCSSCLFIGTGFTG
jgi:hypothetical protein